MVTSSTRVVQVTNIAPQATKDQMQALFGYLGKIEDIRLYPTIRDVSCPVQSRICYVKFVDATTVGIAQHMTNTVFIDRALIVIPVTSGDIPDEYYALEMTRNGTIVPGFNVNEPKLPPNVSNQIQAVGNEQMIITTDPQLDTNDLPLYPPLPVHYDSIKVEETRRTILVKHPDPSSIAPEELIEFFTTAGEVKYLRTCERTSTNTTYYLVEFTDQSSIVAALKLNEKEFKGHQLDIQHATQPIVKPQAKSNEAAQKEIEEAMSRFKEAQNMINASIEPVIGMLTKDKRGSARRTRSRSRGRRRRTRSRSRSRRSRSRSATAARRRRSTSRPAARANKSRSRSRRKRSKSRKRTRSRSHRRRTRTRSRSKKRPTSRHRSKERTPEKRGRSRDRRAHRRTSRDKDQKSREKSKKDESVEKKRSRSRSRKRSRSRDKKKERAKRSRSRPNRRRTPSKKRSRSRSRDKKKERKDKKDGGARRTKSRSKSKLTRPHEDEDVDKSVTTGNHSEKSDNMDISNSP